MRLLVVSYYYTPAVSARAFRWSTLAEHWARQGHPVDVVSHWMPGLPREELLGGVHVRRVGRSIRGTLNVALQRANRWSASHRAGPGDAPVSRRTTTFPPAYFRAARAIYDLTWKKVFWPDHACRWFFPARRAARTLLRTHRYDALVTVSWPFTGHVVGGRLKDEFPGVPWLMDVGDPFCFVEDTTTNNLALYRGLNERVERELFARADAVSVTTEPTRAIYARLFPESASKIGVIPPLIPHAEAASSDGPVFGPGEGRIRLAFLGTLQWPIRTPDFLLRLFARLLESPVGERVELHFFGNVRECRASFEPYQHLVGRRIFLHGQVPRRVAIHAAREADVLVNLGNETVFQLPSKVAEYASLGKPVLNLVRVAGDSSMEFFRTYPAALGVQDPGGGEPDGATVERVAAFVARAAPVDPVVLEEWLARYRVERIAADYEALLEPPGTGGDGSIYPVTDA